MSNLYRVSTRALAALVVAALAVGSSVSQAGRVEPIDSASPAAPAVMACSLDDSDDAAQPYLIRCDDDSDCGVRWHCSSAGMCLPDPPECRRNADCGPDAICSDGRCFAI